MTITTTQFLNVPHTRVAEFFGDAANLLRITPAFPRVRLEGSSTAVTPGARYRLRFTAGPLAMTWDSVIETVLPGRGFTDVGSAPIFVSWRHVHRFEPEGTGCRVTDRVECTPRWWTRPFLRMGVHLLFLTRRRALARIFS